MASTFALEMAQYFIDLRIFVTRSFAIQYMTAADSAVMIAILACGVDVLRMTMSSDAEEIVGKLCAANGVELCAEDLTRMKQRLLVARAMSIAVALRLLSNIKGTEFHTHWALRSRLTLYACLPSGFDGGKERMSLYRCFSIP